MQVKLDKVCVAAETLKSMRPGLLIQDNITVRELLNMAQDAFKQYLQG